MGKYALPGICSCVAVIDLGSSVVEESVLSAWVNHYFMVNVPCFKRLLQLTAHRLAGEGVILSVNCE